VVRRERELELEMIKVPELFTIKQQLQNYKVSERRIKIKLGIYILIANSCWLMIMSKLFYLY